MGDVPVDLVETNLSVRKPDGSYLEVGYQTGTEYSLPIVIADFSNPTRRTIVDINGNLHTGLKTLPAESGTDTLNALNDFTIIQTPGYSTLVAHITGTWIGTIKVYGSVDGVGYFEMPSIDRGNNDVVTEIISSGAYVVNCSGLSQIKLIMTIYTSGSAGIAWNMGMGAGSVETFAASGWLNEVVIRDPVNASYVANVDSQGRLKVSLAAITRYVIELWYEDPLAAPLAADTWREVLMYTIPTGYNFEALRFNTIASNATSSARACIEVIGGSYNCSTQVFTDGFALPTPQFASELAIEVLTSVLNNVTITFTYVNQDGVGGRTATLILASPKLPLVGYIVKVTLQAGDIGVRDITNVTSNTPVTGSFNIALYNQAFFEKMTVAGQNYTQLASREAIVATQGTTIVFHYRSSQTAAANRTIGLLGTLVPL